jgi:protein TonB
MLPILLLVLGFAGDENAVRPKPISRVSPEYAAAAKAEGVQGKVGLAVDIDEKGNTTRVTVVKKLHPDLDKNAADAVKQWKWEPARKDGKPIAATETLDINFTLSQ